MLVPIAYYLEAGVAQIARNKAMGTLVDRRRDNCSRFVETWVQALATSFIHSKSDLASLTLEDIMEVCLSPAGEKL